MQCDVHAFSCHSPCRWWSRNMTISLVFSLRHHFCPPSWDHAQESSCPHASPEGSPPVCFPYPCLSMPQWVLEGWAGGIESWHLLCFSVLQTLLCKLFCWRHQHWRLTPCVPVLRASAFSLRTMAVDVEWSLLMLELPAMATEWHGSYFGIFLLLPKLSLLTLSLVLTASFLSHCLSPQLVSRESQVAQDKKPSDFSPL